MEELEYKKAFLISAIISGTFFIICGLIFQDLLRAILPAIPGAISSLYYFGSWMKE